MSAETPPVDVSHLAVFDVDGALRQAADNLNNANRRGFVRNAGLVAGAAGLFEIGRAHV